MTKISVVLGGGFGDEGKGKVTNFLSKQDPKQSMVIRFNGGHQAGHTVVHGSLRHVFSSFGSGTLNGTPSFISKYCSIFPSAMLMEHGDLKAMGVNPVLYVDPLTMVTTPYDISANRHQESMDLTAHGSCGAGFGKTVERHETIEHSHRIFAKDLFCEWVLRQKLEMMKSRSVLIGLTDFDVDRYVYDCIKCTEFINLKTELDILTNDKTKHIIFEGAQGILLDREHGIFPYVTRSSTTSKNVFNMLHPFIFHGTDIKIYYLSRCYQTRHGKGPLLGENHQIVLKNNGNETNVTNQWQGEFRKAPLSLPLLKYAIDSDVSYHDRTGIKREVLFSHLDQLDEIPLLTRDGGTYKTSKEGLIEFASNTMKIPVITHNSEKL